MVIKVLRRTCYIYIYSNTLFTITNGSGSKQSRQLISDVNALEKYQYQEVIMHFNVGFLRGSQKRGLKNATII